ncbi:MAG: molybdopterin biosynthesis protein, partial [Rhodobacteraceae bacterium]|nr:molybdopterin biosynthesis protein [Paracoccaceae bacterium]
MHFGALALSEAEGAILAHSMALPGGRLRKGRVLGKADIAALQAAGVAEVIAARLGPDDMGEDDAAARIGA